MNNVNRVVMAGRSLGKSTINDLILRAHLEKKNSYAIRLSKECKIAIRKNNKKKFIKMMRYQIRGVNGKDSHIDPSYLNFENYRRVYLRPLSPYTFEWEESKEGSIRDFFNRWIADIQDRNESNAIFPIVPDSSDKKDILKPLEFKIEFSNLNPPRDPNQCLV